MGEMATMHGVERIDGLWRKVMGKWERATTHKAPEFYGY